MLIICGAERASQPDKKPHRRFEDQSRRLHSPADTEGSSSNTMGGSDLPHKSSASLLVSAKNFNLRTPHFDEIESSNCKISDILSALKNMLTVMIAASDKVDHSADHLSIANPLVSILEIPVW